MADYLDGETVRNTTEIVLTHQETRMAKDGEDKFELQILGVFT